jgi:uroporphyrinogen-III synthase
VGELSRLVLVTRPEPGAAETAARLSALGWRPVVAPALVLAPSRAALPRAQAVLLTSRAAARALPPLALPVLAVGEATAEEARRQGARDVRAAAGDAAALAGLADETLDPAAGPLLLAVGEGYGQELAADLRGRGFRVLRRVVYRARPAPALPDKARAALRGGGLRAALFFSPRSARCALAQLRAAGLEADLAEAEALAISPRVARAAEGAPWRRVQVAASPDEASLLALLGRP